MSLHFPERLSAMVPGRRRIVSMVALCVGVVALAGCSDETEAGRLAMPKPATEEGQSTLDLWQGAWIAILLTGAIVWGLIFYVIWRYRRRSDDEVPVQTRYNLPLEIFYTVFPVIMVVVFFSHTVRVQNIVLNDDKPVDNYITVVGQQWTWTFNYPNGPNGKNVYDVGINASTSADNDPTIWLPVNETTRFDLVSPDVIHDFGVPAFLIKMDVIPGQTNHYQVTPTTEGTYAGKCYELCGTYHSRMLFNVKVVTRAEYDAHLQDLYDSGSTSEDPIVGGKYATTQVGADGAADFDEKRAE